jgi:hypothetical protein
MFWKKKKQKESVDVGFKGADVIVNPGSDIQRKRNAARAERLRQVLEGLPENSPDRAVIKKELETREAFIKLKDLGG